jgi:hypothetical protein
VARGSLKARALGTNCSEHRESALNVGGGAGSTHLGMTGNASQQNKTPKDGLLLCDVGSVQACSNPLLTISFVNSTFYLVPERTKDSHVL